jgi:CRP/FNR family cyclic AMP-dependent transcriptional regulator
MIPSASVLFRENDSLSSIFRSYGRVKVLSPDQKDWTPDASAIYMVSQGLLKVYLISENGQEKFLWLLSDGSLVLTFTTLLDKRIRILEYTTLYCIDKKDLLQIFNREPQTFDLFMSQIYERHEVTMLRQMENDSERAISRLARLLYSVAVLTKSGSEEVHLRRYLTRQDMAYYVGIHVTNVTKMLQQLEREGCLRREGRDIVVTDREKMKTFFD